jgi:hypothetical protein
MILMRSVLLPFMMVFMTTNNSLIENQQGLNNTNYKEGQSPLMGQY